MNLSDNCVKFLIKADFLGMRIIKDCYEEGIYNN